MKRIGNWWPRDWLRSEKPLKIIGLMSGTSVDSVDAALCKISQRDDGRLSAIVLAFHEHEINASLRGRIFEVFQDGQNSLSLACSLNFEIGEAFANAVEALLAASGTPRGDVAAISSHGQTVYHVAPHMETLAPGPHMRRASTLQIGEAAVIAERTGLPVVADFRVADMAAGGNGAPLVPFADYHLFSRPGKAIIVHNLGGIANCTYLPVSGKSDEVIAFDTGPANMTIDGLTQHFYSGERYDKGGEHAAAGSVNQSLLDQWLAMNYIQAPPPKSTGRELFGQQFVEAILREHDTMAPNDLIATATAFTAQSLAVNLRKYVLPHGPIDEVLLCGGGAYNAYLKTLIEMALRPEIGSVRLLDETGISSKARECVGFALMGYARLMEIPANLPSATGAKHPAILGKITAPPKRSKRD